MLRTAPPSSETVTYNFSKAKAGAHIIPPSPEIPIYSSSKPRNVIGSPQIAQSMGSADGIFPGISRGGPDPPRKFREPLRNFARVGFPCKFKHFSYFARRGQESREFPEGPGTGPWSFPRAEFGVFGIN